MSCLYQIQKNKMTTTSIVMPNDLSDLCRVCLQLPEESQYLDLNTIYDEDDNLTYSQCFTICTQIYLTAGQGVPHHLCKSCGLELQMSYDFRKKVDESNRVLQQYERQMQEDVIHQQKQLQIETQTQSQQENINPEQHHLDESIKVLRSVEDHTLQSQGSLVQQDYVSASEEEEENAVDMLLKISPGDNVQDISINMGLINSLGECVGVEEHLELEDFQNIEALEEEETETLQIKCDENTIPMQIIKYKSKENQDIDDIYYEEEQVEEVVEEYENSQTNSPCVDDEDENENDNENNEDLTWQENVVAVANKEHLPVKLDDEEEEEDEEEEDTYSIKDYIILDEITIDDGNVKSKHKKRNQNSNPKPNASNKTSRKRHVGRYSCDYCQKVFPNYSRMVTHRRCHETDRPKYTCEHCGRMYATKQARECHVQTAHEKSGYTCNICNKVFAVRKSLEIHVRYHTGDFPYVCDLCGKKFAQACHLTTHKNVKHNSVRFCCDYPSCGKFFTSSTSLRNHEYSHGLMPFECEYCELGYPSKSKLKVHIKRKHGMDLNKDQLENMRKFHVMRSKLNVIKVVDIEDEEYVS